jgi:DNA-binding MarR family transcriptional regulator
VSITGFFDMLLYLKKHNECLITDFVRDKVGSPQQIDKIARLMSHKDLVTDEKRPGQRNRRFITITEKGREAAEYAEQLLKLTGEENTY